MRLRSNDTISTSEVKELRKTSFLSYFWLAGVLMAILAYGVTTAIAWGFDELHNQKTKDAEQDERIEQIRVNIAEQGKDIDHIKEGVDILLGRNP